MKRGDAPAWRRPPAATLAAALAALLGGCAVGPDFHRPDAPAVSGFTRVAPASTATADGVAGGGQHFETGREVSAEWWRAFGSPELDAIEKRALDNNPTLAATEAALRQAHENSAAQFGNYFPAAQAGYSVARQRNAVGTLAPALNSGAPLYTLHTAQVSVGYSPDLFGGNRRAVESLRAQEESLRDQWQAARIALAANLAAAVIQEAALRAQTAALQDVIAADGKALDILRRQHDLGYASGMDVALQESALAQAQQALPALERAREQTLDLVAVLAGGFPADTPAVVDLDALQLPADLPLTLPSELVRQRPDVRAAEAQVHAAAAAVGVAVSNRFPQLGLTAVYGGSATHFGEMFNGDNVFWGLAGNVTAPLFDFGVLRHRQHAAEAALDQARAQYRGVVLSAFQEVADTLYAIDADARALNAAVAAETAARRALDLVQRQLASGEVNGLALTTAQVAWQQARVARLQAAATRYIDTVALYATLGGGWKADAD